MMAFKTEKVNMPFAVKDCALIARMAGIDTALNLRELRERLKNAPVECLFHHFCETQIRPTFDDPEFRNDFAIWTARELHDRVLAERLGIINPYANGSFEDLRTMVIELIDDHLAELPFVPWVHKGQDFRFMRAVTVVFDTGVQLHKPEDLIEALPDMSLSTIYYHYIEARRRTEKSTDDFSQWLEGFGEGVEPLLNSLRNIDFYFMSLPELKEHLLAAVSAAVGERARG